MTRSMVLAILTFSLLILANLAIFGFFAFRTLSEQLVQEKLMQGLGEAQDLLARPAQPEREDAFGVTRKLAPRLARFRLFQAVVVLDERGRVLHREVIGGEVVVRATSQEQSREAGRTVREDARLLPVQQTVADKGHRIALEYDEALVRQEVDALRGEFNSKMGIAIGISLLLLCAGLAFVLKAYRRSQIVQEAARKADRMAYVGTLSSGLAHEIRNPLNSMNMNVQLIQEELEESGVDEDGELMEMLEGTRKEVLRLERLVSSFLAYARPTELILKPIQINDLVLEIIGFLEPETQARGVRIDFDGATQLPPIPLDEAQIRQALLNVIQNGVQVSQRGEALTIATRKAGGDKVLVEITDEGPGISAEELKHIFKEFYSTKRGGTGLGLPIAQRIAELHMGGLKVDSEIGKGTKVTFILPMERLDT